MINNEERYIGVKELYAEPCTRGEYHKRRGWTVPADENPADAGYIVRYVDGGYLSWSPADVFLRAYRPVGSLSADMLGVLRAL